MEKLIFCAVSGMCATYLGVKKVFTLHIFTGKKKLKCYQLHALICTV